MALFQINYKGKNFRKMDKSLEIISQEKKRAILCPSNSQLLEIVDHGCHPIALPAWPQKADGDYWIKNMDFTLPYLCVPMWVWLDLCFP